MERDRISQTQLCALLWAGLMAPAAELLPSVTLPAAGRGAWLSTLAALPVVLLLGWMLARAGLGAGGLAGALRRGLGPVLGRAVLLLYLLWGEVLLAVRLRSCAQRLVDSGERDGSLWFFLPAVALLALWMARGKLSAFARAGQIFLGVILLAAGVVLGLSLFQMEAAHLLPLGLKEASAALAAVPPLLGVLGGGVFAAFLLGETEPSRRPGRDWLLWGAGGCLLLGLEQAVVIGNLGPRLALRLNAPFFALAKSVGVEGAFQRVESIIAALWTFADLTALVVLALAVWKAAEGIWSGVGQRSAVTAAILAGAVLGTAVFPAEGMAEGFGRTAALWGNLIMGGILPPLAFLGCLIRGRLRRDPHFVHARGEKAEDIVAGKENEKKTEKTEKSN